MCQIKRKRVKQGVQRHPPERKKWVQKVSAGDIAHISQKTKKERIMHKSLKT